MRISYEWLKSMVDVPEDPSDLVAEFVRTGTEVEAVEKVGADLTNVVTAQVVSKKPHPDSDHMWLCQVSVGDRNVDADGNPVPLQIVCGAQNFEEGDHIVTAMIGAVLPGDFKIKKSKLRGVESCGMNCSARELGLGDDHDGIIILPKDAPVGMDYTDYLGMSDTVIDCEITPNRPDCLSMTGMAVEVAAMYDEDTHIELPSVKSEQGPDAHDLVDVTIDDPELCQRYTARVVRNVKIGPSPEWLARRVVAAGSRPINNVVDVTNYVMFLTGPPLHAFDLGKLTERDGRRHIVVRAAADGEKNAAPLDVGLHLLSLRLQLAADGEHAVRVRLEQRAILVLQAQREGAVAAGERRHARAHRNAAALRGEHLPQQLVNLIGRKGGKGQRAGGRYVAGHISRLDGGIVIVADAVGFAAGSRSHALECGAQGLAGRIAGAHLLPELRGFLRIPAAAGRKRHHLTHRKTSFFKRA